MAAHISTMGNTTIPAEWQDWLNTNRARGCSEASMREAIMQAGIDSARADAWLTAAASGVSSTSSASSAAPAQRDAQAPSVNDASDATQHVVRIPAHNIIALSDATVRVTLRMLSPDIVVLDSLLSHAECDEMIALSQARLKTSTVVDPKTGEFVPITARSSEGAMFQRGATPLIERIEARIAALVNWPVDHAEGLQVLHYRPGGEYRPHFDYFPPDQAGSAAQMRSGGQRIATLIMYLNDGEAGGATIFPSLGLDIPPRKGSALWFSYRDASGQLDSRTLHGGAPVLAGEKWIATKWLRERRYG